MRVVLIGNYAPDGQESMLRYAQMMREGLEQARYEVTLAAPQPVLNWGRAARGVWKWIGYVDKYWLGTGDISRAIRRADIVHVCDHSNAVYVPRDSPLPYVVTCHDLLAVRGALGEDTDCPASAAGRQLQHAILDGLRRSQAVACVSQATLRDARRLLGNYSGRLIVTSNALNYPYRRLEAPELESRLAGLPALARAGSYVLHVGSNLRRKNRETALRAIAAVAGHWHGRIVFAGQPLNSELRQLAGTLGVGARVVEVVKPGNELLEALYNGALALLFPSRFEGFGWPIIEAQACGCAVICSDREPLPEVAGGAAIVCEADDARAFGRAILELGEHSSHRDELVRHGFENAARYNRADMISRFTTLYEQVAGRA